MLVWRKGIIRAALLLATLFLGGCSMLRLGYGQLPELAYWWLDGYADFDGPQSDRVRAGLTDWHAWHRRNELDDLAKLLAQWRGQLAGDITAAQVCLANDAVRERLQRSAQPALPVAAEVLRTLRPEQVQHMERRMAKGLLEARGQFAQPDPQARRDAAFKRTLDRAESFYGRLNETQRELLSRGLAASPFDPVAWLGERQALQQQYLTQLRALLAERADARRLQSLLQAQLNALLSSPRPLHRAYQQRLTDANCALMAQLHNSTTPTQRQHLGEKLQAWEADLRALAGQASVSQRGSAGLQAATALSSAP